MNFGKIYAKLPGFIKYNNFILNHFLNFAKKLRNTSYFKSKEMSPSDFTVSETLRNVQLLNLELLRFIDNVCNKHNIDYWITGGTLLGAVRHGGFIPWDDDVDITFMREDYEKFIEILPNEILKLNYFKEQCGMSLLRENHENSINDFRSVYDFEGDKNLLTFEKLMFFQLAWMKPFIKIDCFPEDYVLEDKLEYFKKNYLATKYKFNDEIKNGKKSFEGEFKSKCEKLGFTRNETKYFNDSLDTIDVYPVSIRKTDEVFPLSVVKFDEYYFKCPKNIDYYLNVLFGPDYMELPETIVFHNVSSLIRSQFKSDNEMNDKFKKDIDYLKEINDNFI